MAVSFHADRNKLILIPAVLFSAYWLKYYYSHADSDSLFWILGPTALLVESLSGISFINEPGLGWINQAHSIVIAPSCGGVNFLILLFVMSSFQLLFSRLSMHHTLQSFVPMIGYSYLTTLLVNALRIWLAIVLYRADIYTDWLTREAVHRIAGICVYYLFLCFSYRSVSFILNKRAGDKQQVGHVFSVTGQVLMLIVPLCWYLLFVIGVPFMHSMSTVNSGQFRLHAFTVLGTCAAITGMLLLAAVLHKWVLQARTGTPSTVQTTKGDGANRQRRTMR